MKQLLIACYGSNFENYPHLLQILRQVAWADPGVELSMFSDKPDYTVRLWDQKDNFSQYPVTFHGPFMELEPSSPPGSSGARQVLQAFRDAAPLYHRFGARSIVMHTNQRAFTTQEKLSLQEDARKAILAVGDICQAEGMHLLVENVGETIHSSMLFDENEFIDLIDVLPAHIGCLVDVGHAAINRWDLGRVIRRLRHRIHAYHLHNNDGTADSHRPLFEPGLLNVPALIADMDRYTPDTDWVLEYAPGPHITPALMEDEVRKLWSLLGRD